MKKQLLTLLSFSLLQLAGMQSGQAQTYNWNGSTGSNFYSPTNWTSTDGSVAFDNAGFKIVRTHATGATPAINQFIDWQPGIFDATGGNLILNADFNVFFNDFLNGNITINSGATFTCRNIIRVGREGLGNVEVHGTLRSNNLDTWQGIFIGVLGGGNGTVNVHDGGIVSGGYQVEVGTRNNYPTGTLNVAAGGLSEAYWNTVIGPNGTLNVNGGNVNCGQGFIVGDLFVDTPNTEGTLNSVVGRVNLNSGTVTVNQNDLDAPFFGMHANAKVTIDNGLLRIRRTGVDFSSTITAAVAAGQIVPAPGKQIMVAFDGNYTNVTAEQVFAVTSNSQKQFVVYPNPVKDYLNIEHQSESVHVEILDIQGRSMVQQNASNRVDVSALPQGLYFIKLQNGTGQSVLKFVKK